MHLFSICIHVYIPTVNFSETRSSSRIFLSGNEVKTDLTKSTQSAKYEIISKINAPINIQERRLINDCILKTYAQASYQRFI